MPRTETVPLGRLLLSGTVRGQIKQGTIGGASQGAVQPSAEQLAVTLENGVTRAYLGLVAVSDPTLRAFAAQAMQAAANRSTAWSGATQAFPGMP